MKSVVTFLIITLIFTSNAFALKCNKCHRDDKSLENILNQRGIKTKQELINILRSGSKAKIHKILTDEDIGEAAKKLDLR